MLKVDPKQEKSSLKADDFISIIPIFIDNNIQKNDPVLGVKKDRKWIRSKELENEEMKGFRNGIMEPF